MSVRQSMAKWLAMMLTSLLLALPAVTRAEIHIGVILSLTGPGASLGSPSNDAVRLWGDKLAGEPVKIREGVVYSFIGICITVCILCFAFVSLPPAYYPNFIFHRPLDVLPTLVWGLATFGYLAKGTWKTDDFDHWLVLTLILGVVGHLVFMFCARIFDAPYMTAHVLKIVQYGFVLTGLFISMFSIFRSEAEHGTRLSRVNRSLAQEIAERHLVEEALRRSQDELEIRVKVRTADLARANDALQVEIADRTRAEQEPRASSWPTCPTRSARP